MTIEFNLVLGAELSWLPQPEYKDGNPGFHPDGRGKPAAGERKSAENVRIPQKIELIRDGDQVTGLYTHPHWGTVQASDVSWTENHVAFTAPSGKDDKGGETAYFNFSFVLSDASDSVAGFTGGTSPFFRSFLPLEGRITKRS